MASGPPTRISDTPRLPSRSLRLPTVSLAIAINQAVRESDEWFDEPDDIERLTVALNSARDTLDPVAAAGRIAFRVASAQAFAEGNKRTALLLARWVLDANEVDGARLLPADDNQLAE
ncbi:MAG: Fic family protein [Candidatus Dormibacteria bacterium]